MNKTIDDQKDTFECRISALRSEIIDKIITLLEERSLTKLEFDEDKIEDPPYVLWNNENTGTWHDCLVTAISISNGKIHLDIFEEDNGYKDTIDSGDACIATTNLDWLNNIREAVIEMLNMPNIGNKNE